MRSMCVSFLVVTLKMLTWACSLANINKSVHLYQISQNKGPYLILLDRFCSLPDLTEQRFPIQILQDIASLLLPDFIWHCSCFWVTTSSNWSWWRNRQSFRDTRRKVGIQVLCCLTVRSTLLSGITGSGKLRQNLRPETRLVLIQLMRACAQLEASINDKLRVIVITRHILNTAKGTAIASFSF